MFQEQIQRIDSVVIYAALFIVIILGIRIMAYLVNIVIVSVILALMLLPAVDRLKRRGLPDLSATTVITILALLCILALLLMMIWSFGILMHDLPLYQEQLDMRLLEISSFLNRYAGTVSAIKVPDIDLNAVIQVILSSVMGIVDAILYLFFIGVTTFFLLLEAPKISGRFARIMGEESEKTLQVSRMSRYIIDFMIVRTETNLVHGLLFGSSLYLMGVHAAPVWGLLTFLLCYIPYIGLILAAIPAILFAYIQFGIWGAVAVFAIVCVLNLVVENPVFSYLASRRFEVPAFIVLLSVIFWGWLLGILGMFFSVPITLMVLIVFQCSDDLRKINILLGVSHLFEDSASPAAPSESPTMGG